MIFFQNQREKVIAISLCCIPRTWFGCDLNCASMALTSIIRAATLKFVLLNIGIFYLKYQKSMVGFLILQPNVK